MGGAWGEGRGVGGGRAEVCVREGLGERDVDEVRCAACVDEREVSGQRRVGAGWWRDVVASFGESCLLLGVVRLVFEKKLRREVAVSLKMEGRDWWTTGREVCGVALGQLVLDSGGERWVWKREEAEEGEGEVALKVHRWLNVELRLQQDSQG